MITRRKDGSTDIARIRNWRLESGSRDMLESSGYKWYFEEKGKSKISTEYWTNTESLFGWS